MANAKNDAYISVPYDVIGEIASKLKDYSEDLSARANRARTINRDEHRANFLGKEAIEVKHLADILVDSRVTATIRLVCGKCCKDDPRSKNW